ncbi:MAG: type II secretion system minor pseudopilin GspI [Legionellaceae bacterium]|nr:type II secretion system minor pseudopilin GspI [Legionellaceae bacterium]
MSTSPAVPKNGFTLIEVLLALSVIAIAIAALLFAEGQNIRYTERIENKLMQHWVAMQALAKFKIYGHPKAWQSPVTEEMRFFDHSWYWRAYPKAGPYSNTLRIDISVSRNIQGPFTPTLTTFQPL